ncbi:MAG: saccharopine dehydrogenase [Gammaproteobacteria bacterium CG22_combo_CG10-13_8_21_14_all_40_8]|nr:MAG: saccharopine dehydrogenase [Gammaproteobacteria bacterium CG22_combo_CG10-13_8_21_14_all_40_8]
MSQVLILGSGLVAGPLLEYLHKHQYSITLASQFLEEAQELAKGRNHILCKTLNVSDERALSEEVSQHEIVVSFIPYALHPLVAKQCIKHGKHLVTASYLSDEMATFDEQAKEQNITILNEMGFDPGIDHLSAMSIIDQVHDAGGSIRSFISWGAGLPSPEHNDNPFGYKFAWAPKGVLLAMLNQARYLKNGKDVICPATELLKSPLQAWTGEEMNLSGYPNRDSIPYKTAYGLDELQDLLRGTLRYEGYLEIMQDAKILGLLDNTNSPEFTGSWPQLLAQMANIPEASVPSELAVSSRTKEAFEWLGLFDRENLVSQSGTYMDIFCNALENKLVFDQGEKDMAFLLHKFGVSYPDGSHRNIMSKLKLFGDGEGLGYSAMAKAVGTPAAIATHLLLEGVLTERGSIRPTGREYYTHILPLLKDEGIECEESIAEVSREEFFRELL